MKGIVAENFIRAPNQAAISGERIAMPTAPIPEQSNPDFQPKIKKQINHIMLIGSRMDIPQPTEILGMEPVNGLMAIDKAPKIAAPAYVMSVSRELVDLISCCIRINILR